MLAMFLPIVLSSCAVTWTAKPKDVPSYRRCDPVKKFPQMIQIPGLDSAWEIVSDCELYPAEKVSVAIALFQLEWINRFGNSERVGENLNSILIEFSDETRGGSGYSIDGTLVSSATFSGLTQTVGMIWVKTSSPPELLCETSLVHELVHASIWALKGTDGDPDHLGQKHFGWTSSHQLLIQEVNEDLCRLGI